MELIVRAGYARPLGEFSHIQGKESIMKKSIVVSFILLVMSLTSSFADDVRKISVTGKSTITLEAEYAVISIKAEIETKDMSESYNKLTITLEKLSKELSHFGVKENQIRKSIIDQGTRYDWINKKKILKGYYSSSRLEIRVDDIQQLSFIYRTLSNYKMVEILYTEYGRNDTYEVRKGEFRKALEAAKDKANHMASIMNTKLGKIYTIKEESSESYFTGSVYSNTIQRNVKKSGYGVVTISATVFVEFELE